MIEKLVNKQSSEQRYYILKRKEKEAYTHQEKSIIEQIMWTIQHHMYTNIITCTLVSISTYNLVAIYNSSHGSTVQHGAIKFVMKLIFSTNIFQYIFDCTMCRAQCVNIYSIALCVIGEPLEHTKVLPIYSDLQTQVSEVQLFVKYCIIWINNRM